MISSNDITLYDATTISAIAQALVIPMDKCAALTEVLEKAAKQYIWLRNNNSGFNESQTHRKFLQLQKSMEKSTKLFQEITKESLNGVWDFQGGINAINKDHKGREALFQMYHDEYFITAERVVNFLDAIKLACEKAPTANKPVPMRKWTKTEVVLSWLWDIDSFWDENSTVPITEGRCEDGGKYNSKAINILSLMAAPINQSFPSHTISNSMLAEAIKLRRESNPNDAPYNQYIDDDIDLQ